MACRSAVELVEAVETPAGTNSRGTGSGRSCTDRLPRSSASRLARGQRRTRPGPSRRCRCRHPRPRVSSRRCRSRGGTPVDHDGHAHVRRAGGSTLLSSIAPVTRTPRNTVGCVAVSAVARRRHPARTRPGRRASGSEVEATSDADDRRDPTAALGRRNGTTSWSARGGRRARARPPSGRRRTAPCRRGSSSLVRARCPVRVTGQARGRLVRGNGTPEPAMPLGVVLAVAGDRLERDDRQADRERFHSR